VCIPPVEKLTFGDCELEVVIEAPAPKVQVLPSLYDEEKILSMSIQSVSSTV
jgi:hypothetical protein